MKPSELVTIDHLIRFTIFDEDGKTLLKTTNLI